MFGESSIKMNFEVALPIEDVESTLELIKFLREQAELGLKRKEEHERARHNRNKKNKSRADTIKELQSDIKYTEVNIEEYSKELTELQVKLSTLLLPLNPTDAAAAGDDDCQDIIIEETCDCGASFNVKNKTRHLKTKRHLNYVEQSESHVTAEE
jgi:seryl-tRNA synthetase